MHRSGTSMITDVVRKLGAYLGESNDLMSGNSRNLFGYFELEILANLNDRILKSFNGTWKKPVEVSRSKVNVEYVNEAREIIRKLRKRSEIIGLKDPRLSLTIDLWSSLPESVGNKFIFIYRHPFSTADSISKAQKISYEQGLSLWKEYNEAILKFLKGKKYLILNYEDVVKDPEAEVSRIIQYLDISPSDYQIQSALDTIVPVIDHSGTMNKFTEDTLSDSNRELYSQLREISADRRRAESIPKVKRNVELTLENYKTKIKDLDNMVATKEDLFKNVNERLHNAERIISTLKGRKKSLTVEIQNLNDEINYHQVKQSELRNINEILQKEVSEKRPILISTLNKLKMNNKLSKIKTFYKIRKYGGNKLLFKQILFKLAFKQYVGFDELKYLEWQKKYESLLFSKLAKKKVKAKVKFSIVMPTYNTDKSVLRSTINSVLKQRYDNWELCIYDDASTKLETIKYLKKVDSRKDRRIKIKFGKKNGHISYSSNQALKLSTGEYVLFLDHDDQLSEYALYALAELINRKPDTDIVYYDEDKINLGGVRMSPQFKPAWSPDTLLSTMYMAHATYKTTLLREIGGMRIGYEGSQDYDLALRATEKTDKIERIPLILYHWRQVPGSTSVTYETKDYAKDASKKSVQSAIKRRGLDAILKPGLTAPSSNVEYKIVGNPKVSIIIPTKNKLQFLKTTIESIESKTSYGNYEIIIIDNHTTDKDALGYLSSIKKKHTVLEYLDKYNYASINNFAVRHAKGEQVLLLNNDVKIINKEWLTNMLRHSQRKEIGAVGSLLLFKDGTIQHAGVVIGIGGIASHIYREKPVEVYAPLDLPRVTHNVSAVTGACLMVKKSLYEEVKGLDEKLAVAFNDVDFCLKLRNKGYKNIYTPFAKLTHFESVTRGYEHLDPTQEFRFVNEINYFYNKWKNIIKEGDPYYNPNLSLIFNDGRYSFGEKPSIPKKFLNKS